MAEEVRLSELDGEAGDKPLYKSRNKKKAERIRQMWVNTNVGSRHQWRAQEQKSYEFFSNIQLTQEETDGLKESGMPTFIINRVTPVIETLKYFITANSPRFRALGTEGADTDMAHIHESIVDYSWYISDGHLLFGQIVQDSLTKGKGYIHIVIDSNSDRGTGDVKFESVDPFDVYVATMSHDPYERDAAYHIIKKNLPRHDLMRMLPEFARKIKKAQGERDDSSVSDRDTEETYLMLKEDMEDQVDPTDDAGSTDDVLPYYEVYEPVSTKLYNVIVRIEPPIEELKEAKNAIDDQIDKLGQELQVQILEKDAELSAAVQNGEILPERYQLEMQKAQDEAINTINQQRAVMYQKAKQTAERIEEKIFTEEEYEIVRRKTPEYIMSAVPFYQNKIKKSCCVGDTFLYEAILNIPFTPLIALPYTHTGTPFPMSAVSPLVGKQQEINKAHQIMIHNANLSSNLRWKYVEGEIDTEQWEQYSSAPGALLPYRPGMSGEGPKEIMPQPINNAFFTIEQDSKSDIEYMAGVFPGMMGQLTKNDEPYRGLLARDEFGTRRIRSWIGNVLEPWLEHVGKVFIDMAKETYTIHKVFRIVQPNPGGSFDSEQFEINVPLYDDFQKEIGRFNDFSSIRYDLRIIPGSTLPINRLAVREENKELFQLGLIDDVAFIQETDIKNKEALLRRNSMLMKQKQQIESMDEEIKMKDDQIRGLMNQLIQSGIKAEIKETEKEIYKSKTDTLAQDKLFQQRLNDELSKVRTELKAELKSIKAQVGKKPENK